MKRKAYYIQKPDGQLLKGGGVAMVYPTLPEARKAARAVLGIIGGWNWLKGEFVPRKMG